MTRKLLTSIFSLCFIGLAFSQSWQIFKPEAKLIINDIFCTDVNTSYVAGSNGLISKTTDGGTTWSNLSTGISKNITCVHCTSANTCYAVGENCIIRSTNGGSDWIIDSTSVPHGGGNIYFFNQQIGFVTQTGSNSIFKTTNAGTTWNQVTIPDSLGVISKVKFTDNQNGFAIAQQYNTNLNQANGLVLKTSNGGQSWVIMHSEPNLIFNDFDFPTAQVGFISTVQGNVVKTINGGNNWVKTNLGTGDNLLSVYFIDQNIGFVAGTHGKLYKTINRGTSWTLLDTGKDYMFNTVFFLNANTGFVTVTGNRVLKTITGGI